jgi:DNA polymerase-1
MIHRAFHALPETLTSASGEVANATYGFTVMLLKILNEEQPDYIAVTFDRPTPTFRHIQFADYKAHRPTLPETMRPQFGRIREIVEAFNIPIYEKDGFEADDVLGTLSVQANQQGVQTIILTGDMDTLQLVNQHVHVMAAKRGITEVVIYDENAVQARYGFGPAYIPDYKGLVGDKSDNIPGVPGVGEKTASRLIGEFGSLENIFAHLAELKPKEQRLLTGKEDQAKQSKYLATIVLNAPVQLDLEACKPDKLDREKILALFREMDFRSLPNKLPGGSGSGEAAPAQQSGARQRQRPELAQDEELLLAAPIGIVPILTPPEPPDFKTTFETPGQLQAGVPAPTTGAEGAAPEEEEPDAVQLNLFGLPEPAQTQVRSLRMPAETSQPSFFLDEVEELKKGESDAQKHTSTSLVTNDSEMQQLVQQLQNAGSFAFDTETTSEDPWHAELVGMSISSTPGQAFYIPLGHVVTPDNQEPGPQLAMKEALEALRPVLEDERIQKYMHNAKYDMLLLARYGISIQGLAFDSMLGAYLTNPGQRGLGLKEQTFQRLGIVMTPITDLIGRGSKALSMSQVPVRIAADYAGADADMTLRLVAPISEELKKHGLWDLYTRVENPLLPVLMQMEMHGVALDEAFLRELEITLKDKLETLVQEIYGSLGHEFNINSPKQLGDILFGELKLPSGKKTKTGYSVSADVIEGLRGQHPMVDYLLGYRQLSKLKSTYVDALLSLMDTTTGRIHTSYNQTVASSGRLSSTNPNLQNIPVRTEEGRQIRRAFVATPGSLFLTADYSQFELRILAHITHEQRLVEAFSQDEDIHTITAASLFEIPPEEVNRDQRRLAKTVVYAVLYGQSAFGLAQVTRMSNSDSAAFIKRYHETFPRVKEYVDRTLNQAHKQGYVNTLFGRKRFFLDMLSLPVQERQALEREAMNMPIQGTNADLIKIAMIRMQYQLQTRKLKSKMLLQVHDELIFEVPEDELDTLKKLVKEVMEGVYKLDVPIEVEIKVGKNWYEAEPTD